jgi:hypothetical protein
MLGFLPIHGAARQCEQRTYTPLTCGFLADCGVRHLYPSPVSTVAEF